MAQVLQLRRGTTAQNDTFTGAVAEVSVDTDRDSLRVHDGTTMGGREIADLQTAVPLLPAASSVAGSDTVPVIQSGVARRATKTQILDGIVDANIDAAAGIADTKLAAISTAGKVSNSATTATSANTANSIVARDSSGNFSAGIVTASLNGSAVTLANGRTVSLTGDVTGVTGVFDGSANISAATTISNNAVTTAKISDANVTSAKLAYDGGPMSGFRNRLINGDFRVAQRGVSFVSGSNNDDTYNLDRWYVLSDGNDAVDISQTTTEVPANGFAAIALDVETVNKKFGIAQIIEQQNCIGAIGGNVTLSFKAKVSATTKLDNVKAAIIAWSGTADTVTSDIVSAWEAEGTNPTLIANATYENTPANLNVTTSYATYTVTANVDTASTKNLIVFIWSDVDDTTAGDFLYITDAQLESGTTATPFEFRPIGTELALCQRYFFRFSAASGNVFGPSRNASTTEARALVSFPVAMRTPVTSVSTSGTAGHYMILHGTTLTSASAAPSFIDGNRFNSTVATSVASGLTAGQASQLAANSSSAHLSFSAEL